MELITQDTEVEVGKYYLVPHAKVVDKYAHEAGTVKNHEFIPIIGHYHKDVQFGVHHEHYHIDGRFIDEGFYTSCSIDEYGRSNNILTHDKEAKGYYVIL